MKFKWSEQAKNYPWAGKDIYIPRKILFLSANHNDNDWSNDLNKDAVRRLCQSQLRQNPFFNGISWTLYGNNFIQENQHGYLPFYCSIRISLAGPRKSPPPENYMVVKKPFYEVLEMLLPDIIFSFGCTLHHYLKQIINDDWTVHHTDERFDVYESTFNVPKKSISTYSLPADLIFGFFSNNFQKRST